MRKAKDKHILPSWDDEANIREENIRATFKEVREKLTILEKKGNPGDLNLHFDRLENVDACFFPELLNIAQDGLRLVNKNRNYFLNNGCYGANNFLYALFLLTSSAAISVRNRLQTDIPRELIKKLLDILAKLSFYTTKQGGDIYKRNQEAIIEILFAFRSKELFDFINMSANDSRLKRIKEFLIGAAGIAERAIGKDGLGL